MLTMTIGDFLNRSIENPELAKSFLSDPEVFCMKHRVDEGFRSEAESQIHLITLLAEDDVLSISDLGRAMYYERVSGSFNDFRDSNDYSDKFNDQGPDFTDRFDDRHPE